MSGKGDTPRPRQISDAEYEARHAALDWNNYAPIDSTPWVCSNGHVNSHTRRICRYCDAPFADTTADTTPRKDITETP